MRKSYDPLKNGTSKRPRKMRSAAAVRLIMSLSSILYFKTSSPNPFNDAVCVMGESVKHIIGYEFKNINNGYNILEPSSSG